jgi:hypothetical protein
VTATRAFLNDPTALANGVAYSNRAIGNLARPHFPDGIFDCQRAARAADHDLEPVQ